MLVSSTFVNLSHLFSIFSIICEVFVDLYIFCPYLFSWLYYLYILYCCFYFFISIVGAYSNCYLYILIGSYMLSRFLLSHFSGIHSFSVYFLSVWTISIIFTPISSVFFHFHKLNLLDWSFVNIHLRVH